MDIAAMSGAMTNGSSAAQKEALGFFERLKEDPNGWKICIEALAAAEVEESREFFCFLVVENYIKFRYEEDSQDNKAFLRQFLYSWFSSNQRQSVILNKFAQVVVAVFLIDYPERRWNSFFHDFMALCQHNRHFLLFLKILQQINTEIADRELNKSVKETEKSTLIKDLMRETCMLDLAKFWFSIIPMFRDSCPVIVCLTLETIGAFVSWIDINLITNDCFIPLLFVLFEKPEFRCSVCDCLTGILHKGMDPLVKTQLVEQLMSVPAFKLKLQEVISRNAGDHDDEFVTKLSKLVNTVGIELIEAHKKTKAKAALDASAASQLAVMSTAIESKLSLLYHFLSNKSDVVSLQIHPFAREYIQWTKNKKNTKSEIPADKMKEMIDIFAKIVIEKSKYSLDHDFDCDDPTDFDECRKSCRILFENLILLNANLCVTVVCDELVDPVLKNWRNGHSFPEVEVALYAFYLLGENMNAIGNQKRLEQTLQMLVTSSVSSFPHHAVQLVYFETIVRYDKFFAQSLSFLIPQVLISFLDERGLKHENYKLRSKSCHLFNKFIRSNIKGKGVEKIQSFFEDMLKRLQEFLRVDFADSAPFSSMKQTNGTSSAPLLPEPGLSEDDQLVLYETVVSLIVSNSSYEPVKKHLFLKSFVIDGLWNSFEKMYGTLLAEVGNQPHVNGFSGSFAGNKCRPEVCRLCQKLSHCIFLVARTTKAFSNAHPIKSINGQSMYLACFNNFVKVLSLNVGAENVAVLQSAIRQLLHRLIVCLEESEILPLLPVAIEKIFLPCSTSNANLKTVQELVPLINQVVTKFKHSWLFQRDLLPFLQQIFLPLVTSIFNLTASHELAADEVQSLQKSYYTFLSVLASNNVMDVFLDLQPNVLEQILLTVVQAAAEFPDVATQKTCFGILKKMIECQSVTHGVVRNGPLDGTIIRPEMSATFVDFLYQNVLPACFYGVARVTDGDGNQVMNESIACLKAIQTVRGSEEFVRYLHSEFFVKHFSSFQRKEELVQALLANDTAAAKSAMAAMCPKAGK